MINCFFGNAKLVGNFIHSNGFYSVPAKKFICFLLNSFLYLHERKTMETICVAKVSGIFFIKFEIFRMNGTKLTFIFNFIFYAQVSTLSKNYSILFTGFAYSWTRFNHYLFHL